MCHRNGVIHQDLKPENFLHANKKKSSPLKGIDFGLSVFFRTETEHIYKTNPWSMSSLSGATLLVRPQAEESFLSFFAPAPLFCYYGTMSHLAGLIATSHVIAVVPTSLPSALEARKTSLLESNEQLASPEAALPFNSKMLNTPPAEVTSTLFSGTKQPVTACRGGHSKDVWTKSCKESIV